PRLQKRLVLEREAFIFSPTTHIKRFYDQQTRLSSARPGRGSCPFICRTRFRQHHRSTTKRATRCSACRTWILQHRSVGARTANDEILLLSRNCDWYTIKGRSMEEEVQYTRQKYLQLRYF